MAGEWRERKLGYLQKHKPEIIAIANIGCLTHLQSASDVPIVHWLELLEQSTVKTV